MAQAKVLVFLRPLSALMVYRGWIGPFGRDPGTEREANERADLASRSSGLVSPARRRHTYAEGRRFSIVADWGRRQVEERPLASALRASTSDMA